MKHKDGFQVWAIGRYTDGNLYGSDITPFYDATHHPECSWYSNVMDNKRVMESLKRMRRFRSETTGTVYYVDSIACTDNECTQFLKAVEAGKTTTYELD